MEAEEVGGDTPTPSERRVRLETVDQVRVEMARVYREVRQGKLPPDIGSKLFYMLGVLAKTTEVVTVERRLREIEELLQKGGQRGLEHTG
jgi:Tfp pilus assembly pilus retraction ATPase PilT